MSECCKNCKMRYDISISEYKKGGCSDYDLEGTGFVCMAFGNERKAIWMLGLDQDTAKCECFVPLEVTP